MSVRHPHHLIALLVAVGLAPPACAPWETAAPAAPSPTESPAAPAGPLPHESVYQLDAEWERYTGGELRLADLRGGPVLMAMTFTNCASACPLIVRDMQEIARSMSPDARERLQFVLVSLDPERDTPEAMRGFAEMHGLGAGWTMLRGAEDDIRDLAAVLDVRYRPDEAGQIAHPNAIHLLDADGQVAARHEGLGIDPGPAVAALEAALASSY